MAAPLLSDSWTPGSSGPPSSIPAYTKQVPANALTLQIDNYSMWYLSVPQAAKLIPPLTVGVVLPLFHNSQNIYIQVVSGPGSSPYGVIGTSPGPVLISAYADDQPQSFGISIAGDLAPNVISAQTNGMHPNFKTTILNTFAAGTPFPFLSDEQGVPQVSIGFNPTVDNDNTLGTVAPYYYDIVTAPGNNPQRFGLVTAENIFNATSGNWERMRVASADGIAATGLLAAGLMGWNGAGWDRVHSSAGQLVVALGSNQIDVHTWNGQNTVAGGDNADGIAVVAAGIPRIADELFGFNGSTWDRLRATGGNLQTTDLRVPSQTANQAAVGALGAQVTITLAAFAGLRWIIDYVYWAIRTTVATSIVVDFQVTCTSRGVLFYGTLALPNVINAKDSFILPPDAILTAGVNETVTIQFTAAVASCVQYVDVGAHTVNF